MLATGTAVFLPSGIQAQEWGWEGLTPAGIVILLHPTA